MITRQALPIDVFLFAVTTGVIVWTFGLFNHGNQRTEELAGSDKSNKENVTTTKTDESPMRLPPHVERELRKEERRQQMIPLLTMKKPMYDNVFLTCPENRVLGTISNKKADWYMEKDLAEWVENDKDGNRVLRLKFTPAGRSTTDSAYNVSIKSNCCVACGKNDQGYSRHYIVPYSYRSLFPTQFKTHLPHDIVILCPTCHVTAERHTHWRMRSLETQFRPQWASDQPHIIHLELRRVRTAANALLKYKDQLPASRVQEFQTILEEWCGNKTLTTAALQTAASLDCKQPNPHYMAGPDVIAQWLLCLSENGVEDRLRQFVHEWRQHFLDVVQPRYLPPGWSVDAPVQCDARTGKRGA